MAAKEEAGEPGSSRGGRPRSMQAQQALFDATISLLTSEGFEAMSVEAIAARAGVGKQTIYRWWDSKEELVIDAIKSWQQVHNPLIDTGSFREDFLTMARNALQIWNSPEAKGLAINMLSVMMKHPAVYQAFYEQAVAPRFQQLQSIILRAQERGEIRKDLDIADILGLIGGPFWYQMVFNTGNLSSDPIVAERMVDAILKGIAVRESGESTPS